MAVSLMTVRMMPGNAALVLHGGADRLALGVELHVLGVFFGDGNESLVLIEFGGRISLDLAQDALQMHPAPRKLRGLRRGLGGISGIERQRRLDGEARAPVFAVFDAEDAPLQRVQVLD